MLEPILYTIGGIFLGVVVFRVGWHLEDDDSPKGKKKKKKNDQPAEEIEPIGILRWLIAVPIWCFMIGFMLYIPIGGSFMLYHDWYTYEQLSRQGTRLTVPLVELTIMDEYKTGDYYATYQFNDAMRTESISQDQYRRLKNRDTVDIFAYHDQTAIVGANFRLYALLWLLPVGAGGMAMAGKLLKFILERFHRNLKRFLRLRTDQGLSTPSS